MGWLEGRNSTQQRSSQVAVGQQRFSNNRIVAKLTGTALMTSRRRPRPTREAFDGSENSRYRTIESAVLLLITKLPGVLPLGERVNGIWASLFARKRHCRDDWRGLLVRWRPTLRWSSERYRTRAPLKAALCVLRGGNSFTCDCQILPSCAGSRCRSSPFRQFRHKFIVLLPTDPGPCFAADTVNSGLFPRKATLFHRQDPD